MARWGLMLAMLLVWSTAAVAQLPDRPVRLVVPFPPGGTSDIVARILAAAAGPLLRQGAVVDNRAGAAGNIGTAEVARAQPDGTTLIQCTIGTCASNPFLYVNPGYDLDRSFAPVILTGAVRNAPTVSWMAARVAGTSLISTEALIEKVPKSFQVREVLLLAPGE